MGIAYLYGNGGGGSGGNLSVTAPEGVVVTVSKDDKTYSKFVGTDGLAKFTGLEGGTWTVSITDETQTATTTVNIKIDHSTTIAFFGATITVTFPVPSSSCYCYYKDDPTIQFPATEDELAAGKAVFTVSKSGTWVVFCTDGTDTDQKEVTISSNGSSVSTSLKYHTYLYRNGDSNSYTNITGGWSNGTMSMPSSGIIAGTVTWGASSLTLNAENNSQTTFTNAAVYTTNKINLANYKTLTVVVTSATNNYISGYSEAANYVYVVTGVSEQPLPSNARTSQKITSAKTYPIDVSHISGYNASCYIVLSSISNSMTITEVYLD